MHCQVFRGIGAVQIPVTETYRIFNESGWP